MDFIERLFHISPDAGSGTTELAYLIALIIALVLYFTTARRKSRHVK